MPQTFLRSVTSVAVSSGPSIYRDPLLITSMQLELCTMFYDCDLYELSSAEHIFFAEAIFSIAKKQGGRAGMNTENAKKRPWKVLSHDSAIMEDIVEALFIHKMPHKPKTKSTT